MPKHTISLYDLPSNWLEEDFEAKQDEKLARRREQIRKKDRSIYEKVMRNRKRGSPMTRWLRKKPNDVFSIRWKAPNWMQSVEVFTHATPQRVKVSAADMKKLKRHAG